MSGTVRVAASYAKNGKSRPLPVGPQLKALWRAALAARRTALTVLVNEHGRHNSHNFVHGQTASANAARARATKDRTSCKSFRPSAPSTPV